MEFNSRIMVTGASGMVGTALVLFLKAKGYKNVFEIGIDTCDLRNQNDTNRLLKEINPEYVFHLAAKVGGIQANINRPAEFLYDNIMINSNVIYASQNANVLKLLFLGSSCIYPRVCPQPMKEEYLLTGSLESTNEGYALSKIAGVKLCEYLSKQYSKNFFTIIPPNLFGPRDDFKTQNSHVISSLIRKFHFAKIEGRTKVEIWGSGKARREFLFVEDLVEGLEFFMNIKENLQVLNLGTDKDVSIFELAHIIKEIVGFSGELEFNKTKPEGMQYKLMDSTKAKSLGWQPKNELIEALFKTYYWYQNKEIKL